MRFCPLAQCGNERIYNFGLYPVDPVILSLIYFPKPIVNLISIPDVYTTMKYPPTNLIQAFGLADAWGQAVNFVMKNGMEIKTEYGPMSKDICSVIEIREPFTEPMLHPQFPTKELHVKEYVRQWDRDYDWKKQGLSITTWTG